MTEGSGLLSKIRAFSEGLGSRICFWVWRVSARPMEEEVGPKQSHRMAGLDLANVATVVKRNEKRLIRMRSSSFSRRLHSGTGYRSSHGDHRLGTDATRGAFPPSGRPTKEPVKTEKATGSARKSHLGDGQVG